MARNTSPRSLPHRKLGCLPKLIIGALIVGFLYWLLFAPISETSPSGVSQPDAIDGELSSQQQAGYETLTTQSSKPPRVVAKEGAIRFLSVSVRVPDSVAVSPADKALYFLEQNKDLLQIENVRRNLRLQDVRKDEDGNSFVKFTQEYQGVPVYGSSITVRINSNGEVDLVNGGYLPNLTINVLPSIRSRDAENTAIADFDMQDSKIALPTTLAIYSPAIWGNASEDVPKLAWIVSVTTKTDSSINYLVYVIDALSGNILERINMLPSAGNDLYMELYDAYGSGLSNAELVWYQKGDDTAESNVLSESAMVARDNIKEILTYFSNTFNRYCFDGCGTPVKVYVDVVLFVTVDKQCNAFWHPKEFGEEFIVLCKGFDQSIDVLAHEYGHGIVAYSTTWQLNVGEPGALHEAYGDLFAVFIDKKDPWLITGNDDFVIRDLMNPRSRDYPTHIDDKRTSCEGDEGCAHTNSVIFTHSAYLMYKNGVQIQKLQHVFYHALTNGMDETSDLKSAANIVVQSCETLANDLSFNPDISDKDCQTVTEAFISTGLIEASSSPPPTLPPELLDAIKQWLADIQQQIRDLVDQIIGDLRQKIEEAINNLLESIKQKIEEGIQNLIQELLNMLIDAINQFFIQLCGIPCLPAFIPVGTVLLRFHRRKKS